MTKRSLAAAQWRSLKYEDMYLYELRDGVEAERIIGSWIDFYNETPSMADALGAWGPGMHSSRAGELFSPVNPVCQPLPLPRKTTHRTCRPNRRYGVRST